MLSELTFEGHVVEIGLGKVFGLLSSYYYQFILIGISLYFVIVINASFVDSITYAMMVVYIPNACHNSQ